MQHMMAQALVREVLRCKSNDLQPPPVSGVSWSMGPQRLSRRSNPNTPYRLLCNTAYCGVVITSRSRGTLPRMPCMQQAHRHAIGLQITMHL